MHGSDAPSSWTDEQLFESLRAESASESPLAPAEALGILFERYHVRVLRQCERLLGDSAGAEDATHEIFLGLLEKPRPYESRRGFGAWLYVVTRNHCLNLLRRSRREVGHDSWEEILQADEPHDAARRRAEETSILASIESFCERELTPMEQRVVRLRFGWGFSVKQINELLDLTNASGARTHLTTATRKLREAFVTPDEDATGKEGQR